MNTLIRVPTEDADLVLPVVTPYLESALAYGHHALGVEALSDKILDGTYLLWVLHDTDTHETLGALVTGVMIYGQSGMAVDLIAVGADVPFEEWAVFLKDIEDYARRIGATELEASGRPAWQRMLGKYGYSVKEVKMAKVLGDG